MLYKKSLPYLLLVISQAAFAAQPPSAGSEMQQIPSAPIPQKTAPEVEIEQANSPAIAKIDRVKIIVKSISISGAQAYSQTQLLALTGFKAESELTLSDLRVMAAKIAEYYHRNGYFVTRVYLPTQEIKDGVVTISVIEGHYGKVTLVNKTNLSNSLANNLLSGLNNGDLIASAPLASSLLLLSDLPGVKVKSTLAPGASVGSSDLIVNVIPDQRVSGSVDADNAGNRYTGTNRIGATVNLNNPSGQGDVATLRTMTSGSGLSYARASYQMQFGKLKTGIAYSDLIYALGQEFESLQANGSAEIESVYASYPIDRSRNNNLNIQLAYDAKTFQDKVNSTSSVTDKKAGVLMSSINGDHRDNIGGGSLSSYSITWVTGKIDIQTPDMLALDAATVLSNGGYSKYGINAMRLQSVTDSTSLFALINGQMTSKNLDVSEKMELGGMNAVRAYPEGEAYADQGYVLNIEVRTQISPLSERLAGQIQLIGFVDTGTVEINKNPWFVSQNNRTLSGAGLGMNWISTNNFVLKTYYAHKLGSETAFSAPDASGRFWIQGVKYF